MRHQRSILTLCTLLVSVVFAAMPSVLLAQQGPIPPPDPTCVPFGQTHLISQNYPTGELEPEFPIWCYPQPQAGAATAIRTASSWVDSWDNTQPAIQTLNDHDYDYRVFPRFIGPPGSFKWGSFINSDHWMIDLVDVSPYNLSGGVLVSPDETFPFVNGKLIVEADGAPGAPGMGGADHFYELDVSGASAPTPWQVDNGYGYGSFGGVGAVGCRLEGSNFVCAMYDSSNRVTGGECPPDGRVCTDNGGRPGRVWETQGVGTANTAASVQGGYAQWPIPGTNLHLSDVMRVCGDNVHDYHCRDRFRMELTRDSMHVYVNGYPAMLIDGLWAVNPATGADNRIPDAWLQNGARFYMTSWINLGQHAPLRWHWNNVSVNPAGGLTAAPSFCLGEIFNGSVNTCAHGHVPGLPENQPPGGGGGGVGTATSTPSAVATATRTPVPTSTIDATQTPVSTPTVRPTATPTSVVAAKCPPGWFRRGRCP